MAPGEFTERLARLPTCGPSAPRLAYLTLWDNALTRQSMDIGEETDLSGTRHRRSGSQQLSSVSTGGATSST